MTEKMSSESFSIDVKPEFMWWRLNHTPQSTYIFLVSFAPWGKAFQFSIWLFQDSKNNEITNNYNYVPHQKIIPSISIPISPPFPDLLQPQRSRRQQNYLVYHGVLYEEMEMWRLLAGLRAN